MDDNHRNSGIDIIGHIPWGTHIGQLYSSKTDFLDAMISYVQSGLMNNELCVWIYAQNIYQNEIEDIIIDGIENADSYIESGQLRLIPHTEWYTKDNTFNEIRINRQWNELIRHALDNGFEGLRAVADTSWLEKSYFRAFSQYEQNVNKIISELPFIVVCLYDAAKVDTYEIAEIIKNHHYVITTHKNSLKLIKNIELLVKEKQLEESKENYKKLLELLPDSVFIHDDKRIYYCNQSAVHIAGLDNAHELKQKSMAEMVSPGKKSDFDKFVKDALEGSADTNYLQSEFINCSGEAKDVEIVATKYYFQGHSALLSVVRDVTPFRKINELEKDLKKNRKLLNDTLEYDKIKNEFFSNISHELRTPLNVILSVIQLLKLQSDNLCQSNKENKYLKMMRQNCFRLLRIVNNLIDITKIDSNYFDIKLQNYDIVSLIREITMSVAEYGRNKGIRILFDSNVEKKIMACDPDQIERIILNLLSNAIKFTPKSGHIWVSVLDKGDKIMIAVKDTGIGIPPDKQNIIFDRFQQADKPLTRQHEGSGIGLSLVKALVEKHNGKITLNSQICKGSEFIIEIPCKIIKEKISNFMHNIGRRDHVEKINIEFSALYS